MQHFNIIDEDQTIYESLALINNNFQSLLSCHSGTVEPAGDSDTPIPAGMLWYNSAENRVYQKDYNNPANWILVNDLNGTGTTKEYVDTQIGDHQHDAQYLKIDSPSIDTQNVNGTPSDQVIFKSNISDVEGLSDQYIAPSSRLFEKTRREVRAFIDTLGNPDKILQQLQDLLELINDNQGSLDNLGIDNINGLRVALDSKMPISRTLEDLGGVRADGGTTTGFNGRILFKSTAAIANGGAVVVGRDGTSNTLQAVRIWDDDGNSPDAVQLGDNGARTFINALSPDHAYVAVGGSVRHRIWNEGNIADLDTVLSNRDFMKATDADVKYLLATGKAADSALLNGVAENVAQSNNTIVKRNSVGDIVTRYFRTNAGAGVESDANYFLVQRSTGTGGDNYARPVSINNIKGALGISSLPNWSASEFDSRYVNVTGDTINGELTISGNFLAHNFRIMDLPRMSMGDGGVSDEYLVLAKKFEGVNLESTGVSGHFKFHKGSVTESHAISDVYVILTIDNNHDFLGLFDQYGTPIMESIDVITIDGSEYYAAKMRATGGTHTDVWQFEGEVYNAANDPNILTRVRLSELNVNFVSVKWQPAKAINSFNLISEASKTFLKLDGTNTMADHLQMASGKHIVMNGPGGIMKSSGYHILHDRDDGQVTLSAGDRNGDLHIGYNTGSGYATRRVSLESDLYTNNNTVLTIDADTGYLYDNGNRVYSASNRVDLAFKDADNIWTGINKLNGGKFTSNNGSADFTIGDAETTIKNNGNIVLEADADQNDATKYLLLKAGNNVLKIASSNSGSSINSMTLNSQVIWNSGNDGAGSGLDADLLDGHDSAYFATSLESMLRGSTAKSSPDFKSSSAYSFNASSGNPTSHKYAGLTYGNEGDVVGQLFTHFSTGETYIRAFNTSWSSWRKLWDNRNMGAGSGLDADLLDGLQSTSFGRLSAQQNWAENNKFNKQVFVGSRGVDISNTGVDSLVTTDGMYVNSDSTSWFGAAHNGSWTSRWGASPNGVWNLEGYSGITPEIQCAGNKVWHAGNDGAGSGLDADTLDGINSDGFVRVEDWSRSFRGSSSTGSSEERWYRIAKATGGSPASGIFTVRGTRSGTHHVVNFIMSASYGANPCVVLLSSSPYGSVPSIRKIRLEYQSTYDEYHVMVQAACDQIIWEATNVIQFSENWVANDTADRNGLEITTTNGDKVIDIAGGNVYSSGARVWTSGNDGDGSGLDADLLDGFQTSASSYGANTIPVRNSSGDITARLFRSNYQNQNTISGAIAYRISTSDNYIRYCSDPAAIRGFLNVPAADAVLAVGGKAADSSLLDGIASGSFLRSDSDNSFSGDLISTERNKGVFGIYDSAKTDQIWSMGTTYRNSATGSNFGNLYGLAYKHTNNPTGGVMAGGHQMVWCDNGTPLAAMGANIWTSGNVTAYSDIRVKKNLELIENALDKVAKINGYTYDRIDIKPDVNQIHNTKNRHVGVIAQEVIEVLPEAVLGGPTKNDPDAHYSVSYGNMVALLIEAIKELKAEVEELKSKV